MKVGPGSVAAVLVLACTAACSDPENERLKSTTRATYDRTTGRLTELTYDSNRNGRIDTWTDMDGNRPVATRIDRNEDGRIDRWEYYDDHGRLARVGFSRKDDGEPDAWAFPGPDGRVLRVEISSTGDETQIDRWERYDPATAGPDGMGTLVGAEEDTDTDGRVDKWETYDKGVLTTAAFDENDDGTPDRRLTYASGRLALIETAPDASGRFTKQVRVK